MKIIKQVTSEIEAYKTSTTEIVEGYQFSQSRLCRRVMLYKNCIYPKGKFDSQGNYKYWFDIISPRVQSEIKNIDFDTKDVVLASDVQTDAGRLLIANARLREFLRETGQAEKIDEAVERGTEWGNVVWKKIKGGYKLMELNKFIVLNQIAETLESSDVIESEILYPIDLRAKKDVWENVDELLESGKTEYDKSVPEFFVYERNGEITTRDYWEAKGEPTKGDDKEYILAKIIVGGCKKESPEQLLFCEELSDKPYHEYHRGPYSGRWMRVGIYEILFDIQTRANEIGNQIAQGLAWSSKTIFKSSDRVIAQNILTDLQNGDIIRSADLSQVQTRMEGMDQLIADWNRLMEMADKLTNSYEVVTGEKMNANTPFSLAALQNTNANKLFDFIREKLGVAFQNVISDWVLPELLRDLKSLDILKITDDSGMLQKYYQMIVDEWYINNLAALPPHGPDEAAVFKDEKMQELMKNKEVSVQLEKEMWKGFLPRVIVNITGENVDLASDLETLKTFIQLEQDPIRRTALIEMAMEKKNIDVSKLPKSPPQPPPQQPGQPQQGQGQPNALDQALATQR